MQQVRLWLSLLGIVVVVGMLPALGPGRLPGPESPVRSIRALPTQTAAALVFGAGETPKGLLQGIGDGSASVLAWSPNGMTLATGGSHGVQIYEESKLVAQLDASTPPISALAWSPDSSLIASASDSVQIWDVGAKKIVRTLDGPHGAVHALSWSSDGTTIAAAGDDNAVKLWNADTGAALASLPYAGILKTVAWRPDSSQLALGGMPRSRSLTDFVEVWDSSTRKVVAHNPPLHDADGVTVLKWSPDGSLLGILGGTLEVWDIDGNAVRPMDNDAGKGARDFTWSPDGQQIATTGQPALTTVGSATVSSDMVISVDVQGSTGSFFFFGDYTGPVLSMDWSSSGQLAYVDSQGAVYVQEVG